MFARRASRAGRARSTKSALVAPRDSASSPRAPDPANRSRTRAPGIEVWRMLNQASRTRPDVGRVLSPAGVFSRRRRNSPATISITPVPRLKPGLGTAQRSKRGDDSRRGTRRNRRDLGLEPEAPLPLVALEPERHVERTGEPGVGHLIGPPEPDGVEDTRTVVELELEMIRA